MSQEMRSLILAKLMGIQMSVEDWIYNIIISIMIFVAETSTGSKQDVIIKL